MAEIVFGKTEEEVKATAGGSKYLTRNVYLWPVVQITGNKTKSGNFALNIGFQTGYENKDKTEKIVEKTYYLLDKSKSYKEIDAKQLEKLRDDLIRLFGTKWDLLTTIRDTKQIDKLEALAGRLTKSEHSIIGQEVTVTYDWPNEGYPNGKEGQYYLEVRYMNAAKDFEFWSNAWAEKAPRKNPNPPKNGSAAATTEIDDEETSAAAAQDPHATAGGFDPQVPDNNDDLPF